MTKTMDINELVSELKEYDGELNVKVWSNGANKAYPISHVGQGYTDGVLDTYVGIVVNVDRNLVDLSKIWHDASEEPKRDEYLLGEDNDGFSIYMWRRQEDGWNLFVGITTLRRWAYIDDLLPKQFGNSEQLKGGEK